MNVIPTHGPGGVLCLLAVLCSLNLSAEIINCLTHVQQDGELFLPC